MIHTENSVVVRAPIEETYAVAEDKGRFPAFIPHVIESREEIAGGRVRFHMAARMKYGFVSRWVSERTAAATHAYAEYRTEGFCRRMGGRWTFEALRPGSDGAPRTRITLTHDFEVGRPILRLVFPIDRLVRACVEDNSRKMLEAIRARVESGQAGPGLRPGSPRSGETVASLLGPVEGHRGHRDHRACSGPFSLWPL